MSKLVVQKYGGTSVGTIERIKKVAKRIARMRKEGLDLVVVVSAMAGETDKLLDMANQISSSKKDREMALLLSSGERISSALLSIALNSIGCSAVSMTGRQIGLLTDNSHTKARIKEVDANRAIKALKNGNVVVAAGFQGISEHGEVTTLGRGGSDTSAAAIAVALNAERCEIYTDVNGVYTADPNVVPNAHKMDRISYDEMLEMSSLGAKVLQFRCVEFCKKYDMPLIVKSSLVEDSKGTLICEEDLSMEQPIVSGIMNDKNQAKITIKGVPDQPGIASKFFIGLAEENLSVDMIIQNVSDEGHTDISFTVTKEDINKATKIVQELGKLIEARNISADPNICKVSIVGAGMRSHPGVAAKMFSALSKENINIIMISTSEIRVSCIIEEQYGELAVRVLHKIFNMTNAEKNS
ncbi:MAG: aspartate kinase [Nitrospina sp.]|jgi:aspartate kinase|nr:aspartate kinase [Nitrospina sp.]MBT6601789.1 aspartate kinase [Nitrospina sp.]